jgi:hypothetical protein
MLTVPLSRAAVALRPPLDIDAAVRIPSHRLCALAQHLKLALVHPVASPQYGLFY